MAWLGLCQAGGVKRAKVNKLKRQDYSAASGASSSDFLRVGARRRRLGFASDAACASGAAPFASDVPISKPSGLAVSSER